MSLNFELKLEQQLRLRILEEGLPKMQRKDLEDAVLMLSKENAFLKNAFISVTNGAYLDNIDEALAMKKLLE